MGMKKKRLISHTIMLIVLTLLVLVYIYPVFLMFMNSFKPFGEVVSDPIAWPKAPTWDNFTYVIDKIKYGQLFFNNVLITVIGIVGIVAFSSLAAYILDRRDSRYTKIIYTVIITPMLIPFQTIMITLLKAMSVINLSNSRIGLGIQYWGFGIPMATFIFFNFMKTIPREIDESAHIDGASTLRTYISVIFPAAEIRHRHRDRSGRHVDLE
jgi:raffinose/stachyose/melibiose transport system permease protein